MLQDIGKTIGLSELELEALLEVRDCLRREQLTFFDMRCGFFCIAGHMGKRLGMDSDKSRSEYTEHISSLPLDSPMRQLCYPPPPKTPPAKGASDINRGYHAGQVEAAQAIDRMLSGGDPWPPTS